MEEETVEYVGRDDRASRRRAHTQRVIQRRLHIIEHVWGWRHEDFWPEHNWFRHPGRLSKYNLNCTCRMCSYMHGYNDMERRKIRENDDRRLERLED